MKYFVGIDGGGTKTEFLCYDESNLRIGGAVFSTIHFMQTSEEEAICTLKNGMREVLPGNVQKGDVFICAGFGGYGKSPEIRKRMEDICAQSFQGMHYCLRNDAEIAIHGAFDGEDGILLIAGTGSIGFAKRGNKVFRCGGWGYLLGDEGSAYWIGKKLLEKFCQQNDNREQKTELSAAVKRRLGLSEAYDLIPYINEHHDRASIAALAVIAYELAEKGDKTAIKLYEEAAAELAQLANSLAEHFDSVCSISYAGSVWKAGQYILVPLKQYLDKRLELMAPKHAPVYGAYLIARETFQSLL